jgi:hypothetical protein
MKTSSFILAAAGALFFISSAQAAELPGSLLDLPTESHAPHHRGRSAAPTNGLQLSSGLQTSGPLNGSGPAPVAARLTDEQWRKMFPRKEPANQVGH